MCDHDNTQLFTIPSWNIDRLRTEFNKVVKKAKKLNCDAPTLVKHGSKEIVDPTYERHVVEGYLTREQAPKIAIHTFSIEGKGPKLAGWKFIGTLDHNSIPGSVIINAVPGESVPDQFYHNDAVCNHCGKIRRRIETFVVKHENGELKQVGRQCIRDFLGHDPAGLIQYLTHLRKFIGDLQDEEKWGYSSGGGSAHWTFDHVEVLKMANAVIRTFGWVSRSQAKSDYMGTEQATADLVLFLMAPRFDKDKERKNLLEKVEWNDEKDSTDAQGALEWLDKQDASGSEYLHNLKAIAASKEGVPSKLFGYWCSLMAAYQREQEKLIRAQRQHRVSEWVGTVKDKIEIVVKVEGKQYLETRYGTTRLHKMIDTDGRALTWFASTSSSMEQGHSYRIIGTVKKHDEYNNWKQTILTRVKVLEEIV